MPWYQENSRGPKGILGVPRGPGGCKGSQGSKRITGVPGGPWNWSGPGGSQGSTFETGLRHVLRPKTILQSN